MAKPEINDFKQILFVEGDSDLHFYRAVLKQQFGLEVFIQNCQGRDQTKDVLEARVNASLLDEKTHLAVVIDADNSARDVTESFVALLKRLTGKTLSSVGGRRGDPGSVCGSRRIVRIPARSRLWFGRHGRQTQPTQARGRASNPLSPAWRSLAIVRRALTRGSWALCWRSRMMTILDLVPEPGPKSSTSRDPSSLL